MFKMIDLACVLARTIKEKLGMIRHRKKKKKDISNGENRLIRELDAKLKGLKQVVAGEAINYTAGILGGKQRRKKGVSRKVKRKALRKMTFIAKVFQNKDSENQIKDGKITDNDIFRKGHSIKH